LFHTRARRRSGGKQEGANMFKRKFVSLALIGSTMGPNLLAMDQQKPKEEPKIEQKQVTSQEQSLKTGEPLNQGNGDKQTQVGELKNPMTQSVRDIFSEAGSKEYTLALEESKANKTTLVQSIVRRTESTWSAHITNGFNRKDFKPADFSWIIEEYSSPKAITAIQSATLFKLMITEVAQDRRKQVIELLSTIALPKNENYFSSESVNAESRSEKYNVVAETIEKHHFKAFKEILAAFPEFVNGITTTPACEREVRGEITDVGWISNTYNYSPTTFSITAWITRKENHYMTGAKKKNNYVNAAKIILERKADGHEKLNPVKNVDKNLFAVAKIMFKGNDITEQLFDSITEKLEPEKAK
jgi:hypothetical protein